MIQKHPRIKSGTAEEPLRSNPWSDCYLTTLVAFSKFLCFQIVADTCKAPCAERLKIRVHVWCNVLKDKQEVRKAPDLYWNEEGGL